MEEEGRNNHVESNVVFAAKKQVKAINTCRRSTIAQADHTLNSRPETKYFPLPSNATDVTAFV